tara:strand:- start:319 stop:1098 length:780 start_codon:yes stop_codon:yes gene_type:complete
MLSNNRRFERVPISEIRDVPEIPHDPSLTRSINEVGQEVPIILEYDGTIPEQPFKIVDGIRRTLSLQHLEIREVLAEVREDSDRYLHAKSTLVTNIARSRNLGAEINAASELTRSILSENDAVERITEATGMHKREAKVLIALRNDLTESALQALVEGRMAATVAKRFAKLPRADQDRLASEPRITGKDVESALRALRNYQLATLELDNIDIPALPSPEPTNLADLVDSYAQRLSGEERTTLVAAATIIRRAEERANAA